MTARRRAITRLLARYTAAAVSPRAWPTSLPLLPSTAVCQNAFQVGTVLNQDYHSGGQATNYGPVVANTLTVAGNPGQLLPFSTLPAGAPTTNTTVTTSITGGKPYNWNG